MIECSLIVQKTFRLSAMAKFSATSIALKWHFFSFLSGVNVHVEYFNLFMKQLGFNPAQIGFTTLLGLSNILIPVYLLFGEKFRARKRVLAIAVVGQSVCCMLPLLSLIIPALQPRCASGTAMDSFDPTQQALARNAPMHFNYANNTNNLKRSVVYSQNNIVLSRSNVETPYFIRKSRALALLNGLIRTKNARKQPSSVSKLEYFLNYSTTNITIVRNASSHLKYSTNPTRSSNILYHPQPWLSALFLILIFSRSQIIVFERTDIVLTNLATITYLKEENASYGAYFLWSQLGTALSISFVAGLAGFISIPICGVEKSGYFIAFIWAFVILLLSLPSLPWFKFEYDEKKRFNWSDVKDNVFNAHYMFAVLFYAGLCFSFQIYWEFWYLNGLSASPLLLGGGVLIRRSLLALSTFGSGYLIRKIGDLNTICFALFLYSTSFLALSFARIAWLVLLIDAFQAAAYGISYCAFTVLFYKLSSTENSSIILGMYQARVKAREPRLLAR